MVRIEIQVPFGYTDADIREAIHARIPISDEEILAFSILRRTPEHTDAFSYRISLALTAPEEKERGLLKMRKTVFPYTEPHYVLPSVKSVLRPVVVGAGPAGLFAALALAEAGLCPIVLERGEPVEKRQASIRRYHLTGIPDPESNAQFGEGGAGTFSDGKLKYGAADAYNRKVLCEFVAAGAPETILYDALPHLGTDKLPGIVTALRRKIESLGGEVRFGAKFTALVFTGEKLAAVRYETHGGMQEILTDAAFLAIGHSARDTVEGLREAGVRFIPKGFGIGVRIEHRRETINEIVYGKDRPADLPTASYHLVTHLENGHSVYSFCMCPGGTVVAAGTDPDGICTNGMSEYRRDGDNSNAALLVSVTPADFESESPFAGFDLQRKIERAAYLAGGADGKAPVIRLGDFLAGRESGSFGSVLPTYPIGTRMASPDRYLPPFVTESLRAAFSDFDAHLPGYLDPDAVLTGAETRSTSPVRILRDAETFVAFGLPGVYPCGEGAGYVGGIVSSASDGLRAAEAYVRSLQ